MKRSVAAFYCIILIPRERIVDALLAYRSSRNKITVTSPKRLIGVLI